MWGDDMKIGIIQGTSQIDKNSILYECTKEYGEVTNFGCFENEDNYSYVEIALEICLLISNCVLFDVPPLKYLPASVPLKISI